jgi:hypothetical protein
MTTQQAEPLALPDVTWGYTPETGQLMASCPPHSAEVHRDPKCGQPVFHLTLRGREHEDGRPGAETRSRQGLAQTQNLLGALRGILDECRLAGLLRTPSPGMRNSLASVALLEALIKDRGRKGR